MESTPLVVSGRWSSVRSLVVYNNKVQLNSKPSHIDQVGTDVIILANRNSVCILSISEINRRQEKTRGHISDNQEDPISIKNTIIIIHWYTKDKSDPITDLISKIITTRKLCPFRLIILCKSASQKLALKYINSPDLTWLDLTWWVWKLCCYFIEQNRMCPQMNVLIGITQVIIGSFAPAPAGKQPSTTTSRHRTLNLDMAWQL